MKPVAKLRPPDHAIIVCEKSRRQSGRSREGDRAIGVRGNEPRYVLGIGGPVRKRLSQKSERSVVRGVGPQPKDEDQEPGEDRKEEPVFHGDSLAGPKLS